jgi:hypothetical protein
MNARNETNLSAEPILEMDEIQGIAVPGFFKPYQMLLGIRFSRDATSIRDIRRLLASLAPRISTAAVALADRRAHRLGEKSGEPFFPLVAIA